MKTNGTTVVLLIAAALCGFSFHLGERRATGAGGPACAASPCEELYSWWPGPSTGNFSAQVAGSTWPFGPTDNTTFAIKNVFLPAASGNTGPLVQNGTFDRWTWTNSTSGCAFINGNPPSPEVITPSGTATLPMGAAGLTRLVCTHH
jgi:hypothetical protein